jgi:type I restriction enzyme R subunit
MAEQGQSYLAATGKSGGNDEKLGRLLYETFLDKEKRQEFVEFFREVETLYEILSPAPELRDYIDDYNRLADLYVMLHNAYGKQTQFTHKTEMLVRENADAHGLKEMTKIVEFDADALEALKKKQGSDNAKIINLVKSLTKSATDKGEKEPYLISIAERAESVVSALEDRQASTHDAMDQIEAIMREKLEADKVRKESGLGTNTFAIYWLLRQQGLEDAMSLAKEIESVYGRFPNYGSNADEYRRLKAEIYKALLRVVSGRRMVDITEQILRLRRQ